MAKRMTFKQFLFVLPLLAIVGVFSLYPIVSSFLYTFFDYRVNDQQYSNLYLQSSFNAPLFYEDGDYIVYYLNDERTVVDEAGAAQIDALQADIADTIAPYEGATGNQKLDSATLQQLQVFVEDVSTRLDELYAAYPDAEFYHKEDMPYLIEDMNRCFIESNFVGLDNYKALLGDARFGRALVNTLVFTLITVSAELILGMALALIMNRAVKGIGLVRTTALIPWAIPTAVSAVIWKYLYDGSSGIVSYFFAQLGLIGAPNLMLNSPGGAMAAAVLADVWKTTPYMALLLLAGLQTIDRGLYESASIDGAGTVKKFFRITLPLMKPSILVALLFRTLDAFRVYDLIAVLNSGIPETLSIYSYTRMIAQGNYGYGAAIVVAMFVCVALIAFLFVKVMGAEVVQSEGGE